MTKQPITSDIPLGLPKEKTPERIAWEKENQIINAEEKEKNKPKTLEHINNIENPNLIGKPVIIEAVISSTSISYVVPSQIKGTLIEEDQDPQIITPKIKINDSVNISLVAITEETKNHRISAYFKNTYPAGRVVNREEIAHRTIYMVRVRPPVFTLEKNGDKIVDEKGYEYKHLDLYVASDTPLTFQPSTLMRVTGLPLPNPRTQKTTILAFSVEFPEDNFSYNVDKLIELKAVFEKLNVEQRLKWILDNWTLYSHVFGRNNIATAGLLIFFTPLWIRFNQEIQRGWGIGGILGDTTTAKSETIKKLVKLLKAGSLISAETASTVGLTGTATQLEKEGWFIDWGFLPLMDRKLLAIDGSHKLNASCWAALAETERSGVLSIAKAAKNTTYARTRQIRIYNAVDKEVDHYSTKSLSCFLYPIQALTTVLDKTSIARLDLSVFSDQRDVNPETINQKVAKEHDKLLENLADVLKWAWSNKAKIEWTEQAIATLLSEATIFYKKFFYEPIPLVSIDVKNKIARLSVALAYFTLSTNEDLSILTVTEEHVNAVILFLTEEYTKAGLGILAQEQTFEKLTIEDAKEIFLRILNQANLSNLHDILHFIVTQNRVTNKTIQQKFQLTEKSELRPLVATLQNEGLIKSSKGFYPTPKLIEAYKLTDGFATLATLAIPKKEPPQADNKENRTINSGKKTEKTLGDFR